MDTRISATQPRTATAGAGEASSADGAAPADAFAGLLAALGQAPPAPAGSSRVAGEEPAAGQPVADQDGLADLAASPMAGADAGNAWPLGGQTLPPVAGLLAALGAAPDGVAVALDDVAGPPAPAPSRLASAPLATTPATLAPLSLAPGAGPGGTSAGLLSSAPASVPGIVGHAASSGTAAPGTGSTLAAGGTAVSAPLLMSVVDGPGQGRQPALTPLPGDSAAPAAAPVPSALRTALGHTAGGEPAATPELTHPGSTSASAVAPSTAVAAALTEAAASTAATAAPGGGPMAGTPAAPGAGILAGTVSATAVPTGAALDGAASTTPSASLDAAFGTSRWEAAVGQRLSAMVSRGEHVAELVLDPPHLGRLEVRVALQQDQTSVSFVSASAQVRDALESAVPRLRELLGEGGFDLVDVNVSLGQGQAQAQDQGDGERTAAGGADGDLLAGNVVADPGAIAAGEIPPVDAPSAHRGIDAYA